MSEKLKQVLGTVLLIVLLIALAAFTPSGKMSDEADSRYREELDGGWLMEYFGA